MEKYNWHVHILVVEDNPGDLLLIEEFLKDEITLPVIHHATDFKTAEALLNNQQLKFDFILLDLSLPDGIGEALVKKVMAISAETPLIVLTGYTDKNFGTKAISMGVSDYLLKDDLTSSHLFKSLLFTRERSAFNKQLTESEKKYRDIFHSSPQPMWVYDYDTYQFLDVNEAAISHYGYSKDEFLKMTIFHLRIEEDIPELKRILQAAIDQNENHIKGIFQHLKKDGTLITVQIQSKNIDFNNRKAGLVLAIDLTERLQYVEAIEQQNQLFRDIAWTQSHIVRAPLSRLLGLIHLLNEMGEKVHEKVKEIIRYISVSGNELDDIVKEIVRKAETTALNDKYTNSNVD